MDQVSFGSAHYSPQINVVDAAGGYHVWALGIIVTIKALANETGGSYSLFEDLVPPGLGPPLHIHTREDESWYMIDGELEWNVGGKTFNATKGSFIHLPKYVQHGFVNRSGKWAHMLLMYAPGGLETWFLEIGTPIADRNAPGDAPPVTPESIQKALKLIGEKYGVKDAHESTADAEFEKLHQEL